VAGMKRRSLPSHNLTMPRLARLVVLALVAFCADRYGIAQNTPLISGGVGFFTRTSGGDTTYFPYLKPTAAMPLGDHVLIESRGSFAEFFSPTPNGYKTSSFKTVDYLQGDVIAGRHLTIVGGEFLTPFGTYNERLTQIWNETLPDFPLIFGVGTMNTATSVGGMLRGSAFSNQHLSLSYAAYYSSNITNQYFAAERSSGGQGQIYLPEKGLEVGVSYGRSLSGTHENYEGAHVWWEPIDSPFRFRSEYARAPHAAGYWFETDYRLSHFGGPESALGRLEPVFRMQQTFRGQPDSNDSLPSVNTQRADFGLDYHLPHEVRINTNYGRQFASTGDVNIWETGIVYRFVFPVWKSKGQ
jgi:hypothetical protein